MADNPWLHPTSLRRLTAEAEAKAAERYPDNPQLRESFVSAYVAAVIAEQDRSRFVMRHPLAHGREATVAWLLELDLPVDIVLAALEAGGPVEERRAS